MVFAEKKIRGKGFEYELEDVFGKMSFRSKKRLAPGILDALVMYILKVNRSEGEVEGIKFEFKRNNDWQNDDETNNNRRKDRKAL